MIRGLYQVRNHLEEFINLIKIMSGHGMSCILNFDNLELEINDRLRSKGNKDKNEI